MAKSPRIIFSLSEETRAKLEAVQAHHEDESVSATIRRLIKRAHKELTEKK